MIVYPADLQHLVEDLYHTGLPAGFRTGWPALDAHYTVQPGEWTLVSGVPGHGKSEWLDALMVNLARLHGFRFAVYSPENHPLALHTAKLLEKHVGLPFGAGVTSAAGNNAARRMTEAELAEGLKWVDRHFGFIKQRPEDGLSLPWILDSAANWFRAIASVVQDRGENIMVKPTGVVIDPWNELDHRRRDGMSETEFISEVLSDLRQFAREYRTHVFLVAHPRSLLRDKNGKRPVPTPYDISGSAHWYNKADNIVTVYRDVESASSEVELHVQKVRFKRNGRPGLVRLEYDSTTGCYADPAHG